MDASDISKEHLKKLACEAIDQAANELNDISQQIWKNPELLFEEKHACQILTNYLENSGLKVEREYILETGFRAEYGEATKPNVCVICEYDALPDIGHACGHNLIAEVGIGAALGIKAAIDAAMKLGKDIGKLTVYGTPGEEGGGGKVEFIKQGAFQASQIHAAMMAHPWPVNAVDVKGFLCRESVRVKYQGRASHAAGFPWDGVNALDAAVMAYTGVSTMRQQFKPDWKVHGIITNGGAKPNIIPEETELYYYLRASTKKDLGALKQKIVPNFEAAATATGCKVEYEWNSRPYYNVLTNKTLAALYEANAKGHGVQFSQSMRSEDVPAGSTDMGNVSYEVPSIHPMYSIGGTAMNHTRQFTSEAGSSVAQPYTLTQAKVLAMTAIDIYCQPDLVTDMAEDLKEDVAQSQE